MTQIVSRAEWEEMLGRCRALENQIRWAQEAGRADEEKALWAALRKLNAKIRSPQLMRVRGIDA